MIPEIYYNDCKRSQFQIKLVKYYEARAHKKKKERKKEIFKFFILQIKTHSTLIKSLYWDVIINNI